MTNIHRLLSAAGIAALAAAGASPAYAAAGTTAGTVITNTVSVNFQVGGVFADLAIGIEQRHCRSQGRRHHHRWRHHHFGIAGAGCGRHHLHRHHASNDTLDLALAAVNQSGGTAAHGGTDVFDVSTSNTTSITATAFTMSASTPRSPGWTKSLPTPPAPCSWSPTFRSAPPTRKLPVSS